MSKIDMREALEMLKKERELFDRELEKTMQIISNKALKEEYRIKVADEFCEIYTNFDSSKFDKYFIGE